MDRNLPVQELAMSRDKPLRVYAIIAKNLNLMIVNLDFLKYTGVVASD
jgi:hypothetical protein